MDKSAFTNRDTLPAAVKPRLAFPGSGWSPARARQERGRGMADLRWAQQELGRGMADLTAPPR